ncbi:MAG: hypothetical protein ABIV28_07415 [Longimicrobiales bacterium]
MRQAVARVVRMGVLLLPLAFGGCARMIHSYDLAPNGMTRVDDTWRRMLVAGRGDSVASRIVRGGNDVPGDELMRILFIATAAHYGGDYVASNQYLEAAAAIADDRVTKSLSRSALSLISSDGVLPYAPARTERLLIPYYAALNYIALGEMQDAAVEARRLAALLQSNTDADDDVRPLHAALRSFTGAVFEATGNRNDALVAYRNAAALGAPVDTLSLTSTASNTTGTVVVLLENGFVAHRVEQNLFVWLGTDEMHAFGTSGNDREHTASSVAGRVMLAALGPDNARGRHAGRGRGDLHVPLSPDAQRLASNQRQRCDGNAQHGREGRPANGRPHVDQDSSRDAACDDDEDVPYLLKVAWPVYTGGESLGSGVVIAGSDTVYAQFADLSGALVHDYDSQLPLIVARTVARGAAKAAMTQSAKKKASKRNEGLGKLIGLLGNVGNVMLERADTRSWHLLPAGVAVVRLRVPPGAQHLSVSMSGQSAIDLGTVDVRPGTLSFVSRRAW